MVVHIVYNLWQMTILTETNYNRCMACSLENMVICLEDIKSGRCLKGAPKGDYNFKTKMYCNNSLLVYSFCSSILNFCDTQVF